MSNRTNVMGPVILVLAVLCLAACMDQQGTPAQSGTSQNDITKPAPKPTNNPGY